MRESERESVREGRREGGRVKSVWERERVDTNFQSKERGWIPTFSQKREGGY